MSPVEIAVIVIDATTAEQAAKSELGAAAEHLRSDIQQIITIVGQLPPTAAEAARATLLAQKSGFSTAIPRRNPRHAGWTANGCGPIACHSYHPGAVSEVCFRVMISPTTCKLPRHRLSCRPGIGVCLWSCSVQTSEH